jgi:hypothetical protein
MLCLRLLWGRSVCSGPRYENGCGGLLMSLRAPYDAPGSGTGVETFHEHTAQHLPKLPRFLGAVPDLFRLGEAAVPITQKRKNNDFSRLLMVGATGIEPVTPTMSR